MTDKSETVQLLIDEENHGARVDSALSLQLPEISRSFIQKLIESGAVRVNGQLSSSKML